MKKQNLYVENLHEIILDLLKERDELNELISKQDELIDSQDKLISSLERENNSLSELILFNKVSERRNSGVDYDLNISVENSVRDSLRMMIGAIIDSNIKSDVDFSIKKTCNLISLVMSGKRR